MEELLAGGDADVEDLDADGQSLIYCFLLLVSEYTELKLGVWITVHYLGATPIILAAIGGHLPLVQVSLRYPKTFIDAPAEKFDQPIL